MTGKIMLLYNIVITYSDVDGWAITSDLHDMKDVERLILEQARAGIEMINKPYLDSLKATVEAIRAQK